MRKELGSIVGAKIALRSNNGSWVKPCQNPDRSPSCPKLVENDCMDELSQLEGKVQCPWQKGPLAIVSDKA